VVSVRFKMKQNASVTSVLKFKGRIRLFNKNEYIRALPHRRSRRFSKGKSRRYCLYEELFGEEKLCDDDENDDDDELCVRRRD